MASMSYCRHENTAADLRQVLEMWDEFDPEDENEHELRGRAAIIEYALQLVNDYCLTQDDADELYAKAKEVRERERSY